jgi:hypothetical protein
MVFDIDIFRQLDCNDCKKSFLISGSAPIVNIKCTHCGSKNYSIPTPNFNNNLKKNKDERK